MKRYLRIIGQYSFLYILRRVYEETRQIIITFISTVLFRLQCFLNGYACGQNIEVYGKVILRSSGGGGIEVGERVQLISSSWRCSAGALNHPVRLRAIGRAKIILEKGCSLNGTSITCRSTIVRIGSETIISPNVAIMDSDFHIPWPPDQRLFYSGNEHDSPVNIGKRVWIGSNAIILKGVTIGDNAVIGAGSVVVKDIPPNALAVGNPAQVVKYYNAI